MDDLIALDKWINWKVFGGYWNQTVSRNVGTKIGRLLGISKDDGTSFFHWLLALGAIALLLVGLVLFWRPTPTPELQRAAG